MVIAAVFLGTGGLVFLVVGAWFVRRQRGRRADTRAGWGSVGIGLSQLLHGAGFLFGARQPLDLVLALSSAVCAVGGAVLVATAGESLRKRRHRGKRRKLPPLHP